MELLSSFNVTQWAALAATAVLIGLTKAGFDGGALIAVPLMAAVFGARSSSGLLLGIMMSADLIAVWSYRREPSLAHLRRVVPWAALGILAGALVGGLLPERSFKTVMAALILVSAAIMAQREITRRQSRLSDHWAVNILLGIAAGFASMVGNVAGSIMGLCLLSSGLAKGGIIGTSHPADRHFSFSHHRHGYPVRRPAGAPDTGKTLPPLFDRRGHRGRSLSTLYRLTYGRTRDPGPNGRPAQDHLWF